MPATITEARDTVVHFLARLGHRPFAPWCATTAAERQRRLDLPTAFALVGSGAWYSLTHESAGDDLVDLLLPLGWSFGMCGDFLQLFPIPSNQRTA